MDNKIIEKIKYIADLCEQVEWFERGKFNILIDKLGANINITEEELQKEYDKLI